ncbi:MAG: hypothetical protein ACRELG_15770 [Gemmataceae bacterium]
MLSRRPLRPPSRVVVLCGAILLGFVATVRADPKPLPKDEQAKVDKAIDKAVAYLKRKQTKQGNWPTHWKNRYLVGECALPAYALLEAGVPANDPVIQKAADYIRPKVANTDDTYELSLAVLFFDLLGDPQDKTLIQTCALRLIAGQYWTGGWGYICPRFKKGQETALLRVLDAMSKHLKGRKPTKEQVKARRALADPRSVPIWPLLAPSPGDIAEDYKDYRRGRREHHLPPGLKGFKGLAVFQDLDKLPWREVGFNGKNENYPESVPLVGMTDNSNTQFAMLALWVAQHHGIPTEATFRLLVARFERSKIGMYLFSKQLFSKSELANPSNGSMICVDLLGLAIGRGLNLPTPSLAQPAVADLRIMTRLAALYSLIGIPTGQMDKPLPKQSVYFLWSLERVGMLFNLPTLGDKEWYRWGAEVLVSNQLDTGEFDAGDKREDARFPRPDPYGPILKTAFAILFLKHSHPMKDLTPKLPFTAKQLNDAIARLRPSDSRLERSTPTPSRNTKPER